MTRLTSLPLGLLAAIVLAAPLQAAPKHTIRWRLGHQNLDYFEEAARQFKAEVEKGSKGEIAVEIVSGLDAQRQSVGQEIEVADAVAAGQAEMGHSFADVMGRFDQRYYAFEAPYLFRDYRHIEGVLDGPVGRDMLAGLSERGLVGLSFTYSGGASGVATADRALRGPEDLKGLKVGCFGDPMNAAWLERLGAVPVAIGHDVASVPARAKAGELDAVVTTWRNFERPGLEKVFHRMSLVGSTYLVSVTYANEKFFKTLKPEHRELLIKASRLAGRIERAKTIELNEIAKRDLLGKGVRESHASADAKRRLEKALGKGYRDRLEELVGRGLLERVRAAPELEPAPLPESVANWRD